MTLVRAAVGLAGEHSIHAFAIDGTLFARVGNRGPNSVVSAAGLMSCSTGGGSDGCDPVVLASVPPAQGAPTPPAFVQNRLAQVPEPGVAGLLGLGALGLLAARWRTDRTARNAPGG